MPRQMTPREYWEGDRDHKFEVNLVDFAEIEFAGLFQVTHEEVAKVTDLLRAYVRHVDSDPDKEVRASLFKLRGDVIVVTVTEDEQEY